ncbi:MAG: hypothetical protein ACM4D3_17215 [Candidatus Sericytochromatia bacterium]
MSESFMTDAQIAAMSPAQRRDLIARLRRPVAELLPLSVAERMRRAHLGVMVAGAVAMIPWIVYHAFSLPETYNAHDWPLTWIGFDLLLVTFMAATAVLGWLRRQMLVLAAFTTGVLLLCDAWFDIMTAGPHELVTSLAMAGLGEVPLATILIVGALGLVRLEAARLWLLEPGIPLWQIPLLP